MRRRKEGPGVPELQVAAGPPSLVLKPLDFENDFEKFRDKHKHVRGAGKPPARSTWGRQAADPKIDLRKGAKAGKLRRGDRRAPPRRASSSQLLSAQRPRRPQGSRRAVAGLRKAAACTAVCGPRNARRATDGNANSRRTRRKQS